MLLATTVNRPTEGSMLRAGNGTCGDCEGESLCAACDRKRWCRKLRVVIRPVAAAQS